jgi:hypothetical protein
MNDGYGFYWNETTAPVTFWDPDLAPAGGWNHFTPTSLYTSPLLMNPSPAFSFEFYDRPAVPVGWYAAGEYLAFQTTLVGVTADHHKVILPNATDTSFTWRSNGEFVGNTLVAGQVFLGSPLDGNEPPVVAGDVFDVQFAPTDPANFAPTWTGSGASLTKVPEGWTNPTGDSIAHIFGGSFTDIDGDTAGVAVAGLMGTGNGSWQFSLDGGHTWTAFGAVSAGAVRLLSGTDRIRFVPNAGFTGTATLQAYAWDQTTGTDGRTADLSGAGSTGGSTAFSTTLLTATVQVVPPPPVAADFPGAGVWLYTSNGATGGWQELTPADPQQLEEAPDGSVVADFNGAGVWRWTSGNGWRELTAYNPQAFTVDDSGAVVANYGDVGLWRWAPSGGWTQLTPYVAQSVNVDSAGDVVANYGGAGLWRWAAGGGWTQLSPYAAQTVSVDAAGDVVGNFAGVGLWRWAAAGGWQQLTPYAAAN